MNNLAEEYKDGGFLEGFDFLTGIGTSLADGPDDPDNQVEGYDYFTGIGTSLGANGADDPGYLDSIIFMDQNSIMEHFRLLMGQLG